MVEESRKPFLRQVWKDHKPNEWHKLVGTLITRPEWVFLCQTHLSTKKTAEPPIAERGAFNATPNVAEQDEKATNQLIKDFG